MISNSLPGTSTIFIAPVPSFCHSTRAAISFSTLPLRPSKRFVVTAQSRSQPSSCDDDVRSLIGQFGHTSGLFSDSGGCGSSSNCVIDAAPWRLDVPTQSEPVSPPPMMTTCLPVAMIWFGDRVAGDDLVLLRQEIHREDDAVEIAARHVEVARRLGAAGEHDRVEFREQLRRGNVDADVRVGPEFHALDRHLRHAPVDQVLFHLEIGNAVAQQAADAVRLLEQHDVVAGARELLRARHARRARADDGDALAGLRGRRLRRDPALFPALVDDEMLDRLDADRIVVDVERARRLARRRAHAAGELGKVVRRVQHVERLRATGAGTRGRSSPG